MSEYSGYVVRFENVSGEKAAQVIQVLKPCLAVLDHFDSSKPADVIIVELMPFIGSEEKRHHYIPIVFTETLAAEIVRKINGINVFAEYVEHELGNEVYIEDINGPLPVLYSHVESDRGGIYENSVDEPEIHTYLRDILYREMAKYIIDLSLESIRSLIYVRKKNLDESSLYKEKEEWTFGWTLVKAVCLAIGVFIAMLIIMFFVTTNEWMSDEASFNVFIGVNKFAWAIGILSLIGLPFINMIIRNHNKKIREEKTHKESVINREYYDMADRLEQCKNKVNTTLETLYGADVIDAKYRDFISISEYYEYMVKQGGQKISVATKIYEENVRRGCIYVFKDISQAFQPTAYEMKKVIYDIRNRIVDLRKRIDAVDEVELNKFIEKTEIDCRRALAKFKNYERFLEGYR